ncbi:hypothetical protein LTR49_008026 [Elasticomyces elasticus]|nr:hypothetical protein LTR49_008026 [Elasticomyces elasticus]
MGCVLSCCGRGVVSATPIPPASSPTDESPLLSPAPSKSQASTSVFDGPTADDEIATTPSPPPAMPRTIAARKGQDSSSGGLAPGKPRPTGCWPQEQQQQQQQ